MSQLRQHQICRPYRAGDVFGGWCTTKISLLEQFNKFCGRAGSPLRAVGLLVFGFVFTRSQGAAAMLPRSSLAKKTKIPRSARLQNFFHCSRGAVAKRGLVRSHVYE